ncbi:MULTISPECIES: FecR family protein [unclassified Myroides]|uniref:FecR family protein n=1 Tax=unclassified Myroides TaxID=2642485 RepID=UPI003D2F7C45
MEKKFKTILQQHLQDSASPKEEEAIESFVEKMQENGIPLQEVQQNLPLKNALYRSILAQSSAKKRLKKRKNQGIIAGVLVLFLSTLGYYVQASLPQTYTSAEDTQLITLADQSKITLFPHSKLTVFNSYNQTDRQVQLIGKAFFSISTNKQLPFTVRTKELETSVLGTSFLIEEDKTSTAIEVHTGKVKVQTKTPTDYVILLPQESAHFENQRLQKYNAQNDRMSSWNQSLNMVNASFAHWKASIEREFDILILSESKAIQHIKITGDYRNSNLQDILDSFCFIHNLSYSNQNNLITINETNTHDSQH